MSQASSKERTSILRAPAESTQRPQTGIMAERDGNAICKHLKKALGCQGWTESFLVEDAEAQREKKAFPPGYGSQFSVHFQSRPGARSGTGTAVTTWGLALASL